MVGEGDVQARFACSPHRDRVGPVEAVGPVEQAADQVGMAAVGGRCRQVPGVGGVGADREPDPPAVQLERLPGGARADAGGPLRGGDVLLVVPRGGPPVATEDEDGDVDRATVPGRGTGDDRRADAGTDLGERIEPRVTEIERVPPRIADDSA